MLSDRPLLALLSALAIGLLVGTERGWARRDVAEGRRIAGVRTYAALGLLGGMAGVLSLEAGVVVLAAGVLAVTIVLATAYAVDARAGDDAGITSEVAALATFVFAAAAGRGQAEVAGAGAVVMTLLLGLKPELHGWLTRINRDELQAALKLLLLSVVLLPILPNAGYGPWEVLNPREIWLMVVLIAALSFGGYVAVRALGPTRGVLATGVLGGVASSTALTLHFSRLGAAASGSTATLAAGILSANLAMLLRIAVILAVVDRALLGEAGTPLAAMALASAAGAAVLAGRGGRHGDERPASLWNPLELGPALGFGAFLALVMLLAAAARAWLGTGGILGLAALLGAADVNAITIAIARATPADGPEPVAAAIAIAAIANTVFKSGVAAALGGRALALGAAVPLSAVALIGAVIAFAGLR